MATTPRAGKRTLACRPCPRHTSIAYTPSGYGSIGCTMYLLTIFLGVAEALYRPPHIIPKGQLCRTAMSCNHHALDKSGQYPQSHHVGLTSWREPEGPAGDLHCFIHVFAFHGISSMPLHLCIGGVALPKIPRLDFKLVF